ncbi:ThiF family adenylyltransferase [Serratia surfactantfaciens]|uniref:ThiF family adenylyltransferase n=1 Tax=Serratia surfactantfaciens TaxID=2741499 RepID=UPI0018E45318|nr:ThiF family adenylyltransferase [Serratia surfactantfaciens]MBI6152193.1 ThiF family adenylyltransferase [Serratia surfactantfaciens]
MADLSDTFLQRGIAALHSSLGAEAAAALLQPAPLRFGEAASFYFPLPQDYTGQERRLRIAFPNSFPRELLRLSIEPSPWLVWPHATPAGLCLYGFQQRPITGSPEFIVEDCISRLRKICSLSLPETDLTLRHAEFCNEITSYWSIQHKHSRQNLILLDRPKMASALFALSDPRQAVPSGHETVWLATDAFVLSQHYKRMIGRSVSLRATESPGFYIKLRSYPGLRTPAPGQLLPWLLPHLAPDDETAFLSWLEAHNSLINKWIVLELPGNERASVYCLNIFLPGTQADRGMKFGLRTARKRPAITDAHRLAKIRTSTLDILDRAEVYSRDVSKTSKTLEKCRVVCVGVGSLGGAVALQLARAGVGHLTLIDPDIFVAANIGRHVLGVDDLGRAKAVALREKIRNDLPFTDVTTCVNFAEFVLLQEPAIFENADLVVVTTADWRSEVSLWREKSKDKSWGMIQAWSEPNALVGHAIFAPDGAYDARDLFNENGNFNYKFTEWPDDGIVELPACGESFIPGSFMGITNIALMTSQMAVNALAKRTNTPIWTSSIYRPQDVAILHGKYIGPSLTDGVQQTILEREWPVIKENGK